VAGEEYRTNDSLDFKDKIQLSSQNQTLKLQSLKSLKFGKKIIGELILESENYYIKGDINPDKLYLKLLFGCKLDSATAF
jgi:hypothetical protein